MLPVVGVESLNLDVHMNVTIGALRCLGPYVRRCGAERCAERGAEKRSWSSHQAVARIQSKDRHGGKPLINAQCIAKHMPD